MSAATLAFRGAAGTVTGSCFEVAFGKRRVLVDCGLFQGPRTLEALNFEPFAFEIREFSGGGRGSVSFRISGSPCALQR